MGPRMGQVVNRQCSGNLQFFCSFCVITLITFLTDVMSVEPVVYLGGILEHFLVRVPGKEANALVFLL